MKILIKLLLLPVSLIYGLVISIRNFLFNTGILKEKSYDIPVISIGNLSTGGTGKTPTTEYLLRLLQKNNIKAAVLSRGYKRKRRGFIILKPEHTATDVGDEPSQMKRKFPETTFAVCKRRRKGIKKLLSSGIHFDVIVLDDAYQHRWVKPGFNILLTQYSRPFAEDLLLPVGSLREPKAAKRRADVIVITKSPKVISPFEVGRLNELLQPLPDQEMYFSFIGYGKAVSFKNQEEEVPLKKFSDYNIVLFTGIANPIPMQNYLRRKCKEVKLIKFADHHTYSTKDYRKVKQVLEDYLLGNKIVVTTEKDARRIEGSHAETFFKTLPMYYLPIKFRFHKSGNNKENFDQKILSYVRENKGDNRVHSQQNRPAT